MTVNFEIKGMLAKLLATEDLMVEHRNVETACFNVQTRVLTLPLWEKASNVVYDLLVAHECGHSIFTYNQDWSKKHKIPLQFVNIVEDARVERLMKNKYAGLAKTFYNGYKQLHEEDFFSLKDDDISQYNLADRVNLYFKIGNFLPIEFNSEESYIVDLIAKTKTFDDVLIAAEKLYNYCKNEQPEQKVATLDNHENSGSQSLTYQEDENSSDDEQKQDQSQPNLNQESEDLKENSNPSENSFQDSENYQEDVNTSKDSDPKVRTMENFENSIRELTSKSYGENIYLEIPKLDIEKVIVKNSKVHKEISSSFDFQQKNIKSNYGDDSEIFKVSDSEFKKFKGYAQKEVNYLVKEFECRKSADSYSRASTSRTGVLDCTKLHSYRYSEDIFKKITTLADGKNHGLVFILDWSVSMSEVLIDTLKQLYNLIWFCKKTSIPFEVYAFTLEWTTVQYNPDDASYVPLEFGPYYEKKPGLFHINERFSLMNFFSSKVSSSELENQMRNIWRIACYYSNMYGVKYYCPSRVNLSGTPLNESLICLHEILPKFKKENKVQKVQCIVLTDGEANCLHYHVEVKKRDSSYIGVHSIVGKNTYLRDRSIGTVYKVPNFYDKFSGVLLKNLKDKFPSVNFIGIRILQGRDVSRFISLYYTCIDEKYEKLRNDWKKNGSFIITDSGYDAYFALSSNTLSQDVEFAVEENASKSTIKTAFAKSLKIKKMNKKILGEFIELIA